MSRNDQYFPHDYNAFSDLKIRAFYSDAGITGYGFYWVVIEQLHKEENCQLPKLEKTYKALAQLMSTNVEQIKTLVEQATDNDLFVKNDEFIISERVLKNMNKRQEISNKRSEAGKISALKRTNAEQVLTNAEQNPTNKKKENKKKGNIKEEKKKEKKEIPPVPVVSLSREWMSENLLKTFEDFKKMRKQIKKPLTDAGSELILNKLEKLSDKKIDIAISIFEQSIENSWQGIFNLKPINKEEQKSEYTFNCFNDVFTALYAEFNGKANVYECEQFLRNEDQNGRCDYPLNEVFSWGCKLCKTKYLINEKPKLNDKRWGLTL